MNDAIKKIDSQLEEKKAKLEGLNSQLQQARQFIQQNEPEFIALQGGIRELNELKKSLTEDKKEDKK